MNTLLSAIFKSKD